MRWILASGAVACVGLMGAITPALAAETITYTYDELGRLLTASSAGTVNNGEKVTIVVDKASNRTTYTVIGA